MRAQKHKKDKGSLLSRILAAFGLLIIAVSASLSPIAYAAGGNVTTVNYAFYCNRGGSVSISHGSLVCNTNSLNNAVVFDKQVASPNTNPKSRFTETVIEVECANGAPKKPSSGMAVTGISCSGGGSVTYLGAKTFSSSTSGRTPTSNGGVGSGGSGSSSSGSSSSTGSTSGGKSNVPQPITAPIPAAQPDPAIKCTAPTTNSGGSSTTSSSKNTGSSTCCTTSQCDLIAKYVNPTINLLAAVFGTIAVLSIIIGGINFSTSEGDPQKAGRAKQRITNTVIALVAFIFFYAFLQFLIPGGLFNK